MADWGPSAYASGVRECISAARFEVLTRLRLGDAFGGKSRWNLRIGVEFAHVPGSVQT